MIFQGLKKLQKQVVLTQPFEMRGHLPLFHVVKNVDLLNSEFDLYLTFMTS